MAGASARIERERQLAAWQAWTTAALVRTGFHAPKKFPPLRKVLPRAGRRGPAARQTLDEQRGVVKLLASMFGGELRAPH